MERDEFLTTALDAEFDCCWKKREDIDLWDNEKDCAILIGDIGDSYKFYIQKILGFNKNDGTMTVEGGCYFLNKETMEWEKDDNITVNTQEIP